MALDLEAIRRKLGQISGNSTARDVLWKPKLDTEVSARLLAFPDNDGQPFKDLWFYYSVGNQTILAPNQFGKPDPVQELITKLRNEGATGDKQAYETAKLLYPKMRCFAPILIRGEESEGVKLWAFGKQVYQMILRFMLDDDYGDITDPKTGHDLKIRSYKKQGGNWAVTEITPRPKSSPLGTPEEVKKWTSNIPNPLDLYELKSYEQISKILNDWLNSDQQNDSLGTSRSAGEDNDEDSGDEETQTSSSMTSKLESLDAAFADLEV
jgi:hypothetical protein